MMYKYSNRQSPCTSRLAAVVKFDKLHTRKLREHLRDEEQFDRYIDDWECEGDL